MSQPAVDRQNAAFWDTLCGGNLARSGGITKREWFLGNLACVVALDLYIVADKRAGA